MATKADWSDGGTPVYAGFWLRFVAFLIDTVLLTVVGGLIGAVFGGVVGGSMGATGSSVEDITAAVTGPAYLIGFLINVIYYVTMESSSRQATLGKSALGLVVTNAEGNRISAGQALGRYFGKYVSALILGIGFIMIAFTERKQGLHDLLAGTLVVKA